MTLRALTITNLKCFIDLRLELAPLTLLTGFNSAGKSTALQAILLLAQGLRSDRGSRYLSLNGPLVRLGSTGDVLSNRAKGSEIEIAVADADDEIEWQFNPVGLKSGALQVQKVIHRTADRADRVWSEHLWVAEPDVTCSLMETFESVVYVSAVRGGTAVAYPVPDAAGLTHADVGIEGQYAPWWYVETADDEIDEVRRHPDEQAGSLRRQLDAYLGDLFPGAQATADELVRTSLVRLGLRTGTTSDWHRPANIGFGLAYAFPLLIALLLAREGQIVVIDSPEAHLHPRAQSKMGELLARFAVAGVQVLVETHSDHLLNGVRLAVKRRLIAPADVTIHFFGGVQDDGTHGVVSPQLDPEGMINAWPGGFFDQAESDLAVLAGWD